VARSLPADPLVRALVLRARQAQLSRRALLAAAGGGLTALALAACAGLDGAPAPARDVSASDPTVTWVSWPLYLDTDDHKRHPTLEAFTKKTGIRVDYRPVIDDNNAYYGTVHTALARGEDIRADTAVLTDWMASRWIRYGYTQELDHARIPNLANLAANLRDVDYDRGRHRSVPWQGGFGGIAWNKEEFPKGFRSVREMFAEPRLKGRIEVLSEMRDTVGLIMLEQGANISKDFTDGEYVNALDVLKKNIADGVIRRVTGNSYTDDLVTGKALAVIGWSGDISATNAEHGDKWQFVLPDAGGTIWNDNFVVPIGSRHRANAEKLINWYYDPEVAAQVAAYVDYISPVEGAKEAAIKIDPALADDPFVFPDEAILAKAHRFRDVTPAKDQAYSEAFQKVLLAA
jgi:spermidine/putrescine transport system substrate-binding protein